jgi:hypothetical protein
VPDAPQRPCSGGCGARVSHGKCPSCRRQTERQRGSARDRGYTAHWDRVVAAFITRLVDLGIPPVCGASLPGGPNTAQYSRCLEQGIQNGERLHTDHEPPLTDEERAAAAAGDRTAFDNPLRLGLLCFDCHREKTRLESARGAA